jgi:hypothetical protein
MSDPEHQPGPVPLKSRVGTVIAALTGLIAIAVSLLVFVFDLLVTPEIGELIVSFVVCGMGLTTGLIVLRRLVPRREPVSLFAKSGGVLLPPAASPTETRAQTQERSPERAETAGDMPGRSEAAAVRNNDRHRAISRYKTPENGSVFAVITIILMSSALSPRLAIGWEFLSFSVTAGCAVALVLYWVRNRQDSGISGYIAPVAGGIIGTACLIGVALVMARFHFLRDFLGLAVGGGCVVALALDWGRRRGGNARISLV